MLARLRQRALRHPSVSPGPSPHLSPAIVSLASQKRGVPHRSPSSEWDAQVPGSRAEAAAVLSIRSGDMFVTPACGWGVKSQAFARPGQACRREAEPLLTAMGKPFEIIAA